MVKTKQGIVSTLVLLLNKVQTYKCATQQKPIVIL